MNFMLQTRRRRFALYALIIIAGILVSCLVMAAIGYNSNQNLSGEPELTTRMTSLDKVRLAEAYHLKAVLGDTFWPGFAALDAPLINWNRDYEFLLGMADPPSGWEVVPEDDFFGDPYFRRPAQNPQNFAVRIGDRWVASVFTKYVLDSSLIEAIQGLLPPVISNIFPYKIFIQPSELQIAGVQHEYFHVVQAQQAPGNFTETGGVYEFDDQYWALDAGMQSAWSEEIELLIDAVEASSDGDARLLGGQFLASRDQRRLDFGLNEDLVGYEVALEWLEGTAKYVELRSWQQAGQDPNYIPLQEMADDPDFESYRDFDGRWDQEIRQARQQATREGDVRFYYTGMLQSYLLDRLAQDWKAQYLEDGITLESLLREALTE